MPIFAWHDCIEVENRVLKMFCRAIFYPYAGITITEERYSSQNNREQLSFAILISLFLYVEYNLRKDN